MINFNFHGRSKWSIKIALELSTRLHTSTHANNVNLVIFMMEMKGSAEDVGFALV